jgi:hypothetical protein
VGYAFSRSDGHWAGWLHAVDADTGFDPVIELIKCGLRLTDPPWFADHIIELYDLVTGIDADIDPEADEPTAAPDDEELDYDKANSEWLVQQIATMRIADPTASAVEVAHRLKVEKAVVEAQWGNGPDNFGDMHRTWVAMQDAAEQERARPGAGNPCTTRSAEPSRSSHSPASSAARGRRSRLIILAGHRGALLPA